VIENKKQVNMIDWTKTAFVFPGQGSQVVGMGSDLASTYSIVRETFEQADELLNVKLSDLCFNGPEDLLNDTVNTQPSLYVCSIAILRALQTECPSAQPIAVAGHSLGEITALAAAEAVTFEDGLRLVQVRAQAMRDAGEGNPGGMAALLGLEVDKANEVCQQAQEETGGVLVVANDNAPGQVVISGDFNTLDVGIERAKAAGAKRGVKLAVSIAAHSPLMGLAAEAFGRKVAETTYNPPRIPVYANVSAVPLRTVDDIRDELNRQLTQNVRWTASVQAMIRDGVTHFIEIGSKDVLTGLLKRIDRSATGAALNSLVSLQTFIAENCKR
jgi:[acyl-carrier-protein] S-malonyltransferase